MKPTDTITNLYNHHLWANLRLLEWCKQLTSDQMQAKVMGTFGSIQETLEHIVRAEKSYVSRISTGQPYRHPPDAAPITIEDMLDLIGRDADARIRDFDPHHISPCP